MKAIASGFRTPTLGIWYQKDENKTTRWVVPEATFSQQQFRDLHWDHINKKLRLNPVHVCRTFSILSVRSVPGLNVDVEILSRHVYIALWDREKILSNIHLIRAVSTDRGESSWSFTPKIGKSVPSLYDGEFVVRVNSDDMKLCILFEFNYTCRTSTGEQNDICCGWASLPLFEPGGSPITHRTFEMNINGGTPYEKGVVLDLNIGAKETVLQSMMGSNHQPRVIVKSVSMSRSSKEMYDMLPVVIVTCQQYTRLIAFFRQYAAMRLCREDQIPPERICDPILSHFPRALLFPDLMDALKTLMDKKVKNSLTLCQRKSSVDLLLKLFQQSFLESAFGLLQCANIPPIIWGDHTAEKARNVFIKAFLQRKDTLGNLLSPGYRHKPLDVRNLTFDI